MNTRVDFEAEVGVIVDKVPMGISVEDAGEHIKWITIINDISLRQLCSIEIKTGFGFLQGKPHSALGQGSIPVLSLDQKNILARVINFMALWLLELKW